MMFNLCACATTALPRQSQIKHYIQTSFSFLSDSVEGVLIPAYGYLDMIRRWSEVFGSSNPFLDNGGSHSIDSHLCS